MQSTLETSPSIIVHLKHHHHCTLDTFITIIVPRQAFGEAIKSASWVAVLCFIVFYVFAVLFRGLYGDNEKLAQNDEYEHEYFMNVPASLLTLFQLMTMDDWANVMRPVGRSLPWSWVFTLLFVLLGMSLMNLIVAIFIDELLKQTAKAQEARDTAALELKQRSQHINTRC